MSIRRIHAAEFFLSPRIRHSRACSDKATDASAYDQDSQIVPYLSGPASEISTLTNMRRFLEKMATL